MNRIGRKIASRKTCWPVTWLTWTDFGTPKELYRTIKNTNEWPNRKRGKEYKWIIYTRRNTNDQYTKENQLYLNQRYSNKGIFSACWIGDSIKKIESNVFMKGWEMITIVHYLGGWNRKYSCLCGVQFDNSY